MTASTQPIIDVLEDGSLQLQPSVPNWIHIRLIYSILVFDWFHVRQFLFVSGTFSGLFPFNWAAPTDCSYHF